MITVTVQERKGTKLWMVLVISVIVHFGFYSFAGDLVVKGLKKYGSSVAEFVVKPKPAPKPKPKPEPKPKPKPKPKPEPKPKEPPKPKPNTEKPPEPPPKEPPKEVFGVTGDSMVSDSSVSVRQGNTLAKVMEKKFTNPNEVKPLPPVKPVKAHKVTKMPRFLQKVKPKYPQRAREEGIEGVVLLKVTISAKGRVTRIRVLRKLGFGCDEAAINMIKKARFEPAYIGDEAVPIEIKIPVRFELDD